MLKYSALLKVTVCAAASLAISQPAYAQITEFILTANDAVAGDNFGWFVSISGDYAVVGAILDDDNGADAGSVYLYTGFASPIGVENETASLPAEFALSQNYPNPFNPETVIEYSIPFRSEVNLIVYNLRGEEVAVLINGTMPAGNHRVSWDASSAASGIYIYRLQASPTSFWRAGDFVRTRKMVSLK